MSTWSEFAARAPKIAEKGEALFVRAGDEALLATVRGDEPPRIHPITVGLRDGGLYVFIHPSGKRSDLETDGRYALHTYMDPDSPDEFAIRGRVRPLEGHRRAEIAAGWPWKVGDEVGGFELLLDEAVLGERGPHEWPPRYSTWAADR
jgi:dipeptidyl aminopeptidase/acylaminoacyl peptidase